MSLELWKQSAQDTIKELEIQEPSPNNAVFLASAIIILSYNKIYDNTEYNYNENENIEEFSENEINIESYDIKEIQENIKLKLENAEKYISQWQQTRNENYKNKAINELKDSEIFIKAAMDKGKDITEIKRHHNAILARLT